MYINTTGDIVDNVTAGLYSWCYTLPLCILWFPGNSVGNACMDKDTVLKVLSQQNNLRSFVLVANNDVLEFFRREQTWYTGKRRLEDVLHEIEEREDLPRQREALWTAQGLLKCDINC